MNDQSQIVETLRESTPSEAVNQGTPVIPETSPAQALTEEQPKRENGVQRRIRELIEERNAERAERQRLTEQLLQRSAPQQQTQSTAPNGPPTLDKFDTYEKYVAAYARWEAKQALAEENEARKRESEQAKHRELIASEQKRANAQAEQMRVMVETAEQKYPDFYDKVFNPALPITPVIGQAMLESDIGKDVGYYLATHPAELYRIAKLSPSSQLREFGKLEVMIEKQASSAAPKPLETLSGKSSVVSDKPSDKDDIGTWIAKRNKQVHRR